MSTSVEIKKPNLPNLASGSFIRGPSEEAAAVDIYKAGQQAKAALKPGAPNPFTSIRSLTTDISDKIGNFINDDSSLADWLDKGKTGLGLKVDESVLTSRLVAASSEFKGAFAELNESLRTGAKLQLSKETGSKISAGLNDVKTLVSASKIQDVNSLANFFNKYTNSKNFKAEDTGAVSSILSGVVIKSQELGIKDMYTSLMDTIQNNALLSAVTKTLVPIAIARNYPDLLRQISSGPYSRMLNIVAPGLSKDLVKDFQLKGAAGTRPIQSFDDFFGTLDRINSDWKRTTRKGSDEDVFDLSSILGGSRDFQRLLYSGVSYFYTGAAKQNGHIGSVGHSAIYGNKAGAFDRLSTGSGADVYAVYGLAGLYQQVTAAASVKKYFPKVALMGTYDMTVPRPSTIRNTTVRKNARQETMDPRLITHALLSLF